MERRQGSRHYRVFRPAYIQRDNSRHVAVLKDISEGGAGFQGDVPLFTGEQLLVSWGAFDLAPAQVKWCDGDRFGLSLDVDGLVSTFPHAYRSVRIPVGLPATIFMHGRRYDGELLNISQAGASISFDGAARRGELATLKCGPFVFENAWLTWTKDGVAGFRLDRPLAIPTIAALLDQNVPFSSLAA